MKNLTMLVVIVVAAGFTHAQQKPATIDDLKWLAGCWEINDPDKKFLNSEQWMLPAGNAMMGMSRTVSKGKMVGFEFLRLVEENGVINYISKPHQNKEETAFKLVRWSASEAVFENPTHDFPQRIFYKLSGDKSLNAGIEGTVGGKSKRSEFPFSRVSCP